MGPVAAKLTSLPVTVVGSHRDGMDLALYWVAFAAAVVALISFGDWFIRQRRRPEIYLRWETPEQRLWSADALVTLPAHKETRLMVIVQNCGTAIADDALINLTVPDYITIKPTRPRPFESEWLHTLGDKYVGSLGRDGGIRFLAIIRTIPPGTDIQVGFILSVDEVVGSLEDRHKVVAEVSHHRFNARGRKWLPTHTGRKAPDLQAGDKWPGPCVPWKQYILVLKSWRMVHALPKGSPRV